MPSQHEPTALPPLLVVVGPTAVGKTELALRLAQAIDGEIVSADSRQVYRGLDIGTAKPTASDRRRVRHHLVDIVDPDQTLSLAQYQALAYAAIDDVLSRSRVPLLVGGTGQYIMAVVEGWVVPRVAPALALRARLYQEAQECGAQALHSRLRELDPLAAARVDPRNVRRLVRALEVCLATGTPFSQQQRKSTPPYRVLLVGLRRPRPELYRIIDSRVDAMLVAGLEAEVRELVARGYGFDLPSMSSVGYRQFESYLAGAAGLADVAADIKRATRRFVRHQANWFRHDDARIHWFEASPDPMSSVLALVRSFLGCGVEPVGAV